MRSGFKMNNKMKAPMLRRREVAPGAQPTREKIPCAKEAPLCGEMMAINQALIGNINLKTRN